MTDKKILITGGLGYIGSHTAIKLFENGYEFIIIDNLSNTSLKNKENLKKIINPLNFLKIDITSKNLCKVFEKHNITDIIHFAALKSVNRSIINPEKYYTNNVYGTINLLNNMVKYGVKNIIFSSSCTVYGEPDNFPVTENSNLKTPLTPYGKSKKMCEEIIIDYSNTNLINSVILRYFNPIGCHSSGLINENLKGDSENIIPHLLSVIKNENKNFNIYGNNYNTLDGTAIRDYININDLADAHIKSLNIVGHKKNDIFNIGTGLGYSVLEILKTFEKNGIKIPYNIVNKRDGDIEKIYANIEKAVNILKWKPVNNLDNSINSIINYCKVNNIL